MRKVLAMLLALMLVVSFAAGCAGTDTPADTAKESDKAPEAEGSDEGEAVVKENVGGLELPLCDEKQELTVMTVWDNALLDSPNDVEGIKKMEERTNVHINWIVYDQTEMLEKYPLTLNTGDYPDIMCPGGTNLYPGGYMQGVEDEVLVDMKDYMQYMPNYMALLNSNEKAYEQAIFDDGELHAVKIINGTDTEVGGPGAGYGPTYRKDILDAMGEEEPKTIQEWHDLLVKCRDNGMTAPMTLENDGGTALSLAWGVNTDWSSNYWQFDRETGKAGFGPMMDGFEDWLNTMADWYAEDLIDKNFTGCCIPIITGDYSNIENDNTMLFDCMFAFQNGTALQEMGNITNQNNYLQAIPGVVLNEGDPLTKCSEAGCIANEIFVTTECDDVELAAKWLDYLYSDEGMMLMHYGIEGESYTMVDGEPVYTDKILNPEEGLSAGQELDYYAMGAFICYNNAQAADRLSIATSPTGASAQVESVDLWKSPEKTICIPVGVALNAEENEVIDQYQTDIITFCQEFMVKTILGTTDMTYAEFKEGLESMGINECIAAYQAACDRFFAR